MSKTVTFQGSALTLVGRDIQSGEFAPDFTASSLDLKPVGLNDFKDKIKIINFFPSLDTPVCDLQVKEFNARAASLSSDVAVIGISMDLPFAQKRFCSVNDIHAHKVVSDYLTRSFGLNYGVLIRELNLLARGVLIIDACNVIRFKSVVPEITHAVDFNETIRQLEEVIKAPKIKINTADLRCRACEGLKSSLPEKVVLEKMRFLSAHWKVIDGKKISREFAFKHYADALYFVDTVAVFAQEQNHHPTIQLAYNKVVVTLSTHAASGLSDNDFVMARIIDSLGN